MKLSKTAISTARRIFRLCQTDGRLDEAKLGAAVRKVAADQPRGYRGILFAVQRLVRAEIERRSVTVESAIDLPQAERERVAAGLVAKYGSDLSFSYKVTPDLLGGLKIRVGDDVFDGSVQGRIDRLAKAF